MLRRTFTFGVAGAYLASSAFGQSEYAGGGTRPVRNFKDMVLLDVSPDGRQVCVYPSASFEPPRGVIRGIIRDATPLTKHTLMVVELGSWTILSSTELRSSPVNVSFFADSPVLYAAMEAERQGDRLAKPVLTVDFAKTKVDELLEPAAPGRGAVSYRALSRQTLLGEERRAGDREADSLFLTQLPGYQEMRRVPLAAAPRKGSVESVSIVSADRKLVVYGYDRSVLLRRTEDLSLVWKQDGVEKSAVDKQLAISATGTLVAAPFERKGSPTVFVFDGATGKEVAAIASEPVTGLAISPDGRYVAVGVTVKDKTDLVPTVRLHEISSGRSVDTLVHDRVPQGKDAASKAAFGPRGVQFTADGKYLLTSTMHTRAWQLT